MLDARTGSIIWSHPSCGCDNGRAVAGDIYAGSAGAEAWSAAVAGLSNTSGGQASSRKPGSTNFLVWWDADTLRELLDSNHVDKYGTGGDTRLLTADGTTSNNGTKSTPALSGDIFGDWREEVVLRTTDNNALRIYTTTNVGDESHLHAAARSAVPRGDRVAEHRVQPAAASELLHRRRHAHAADAEHRDRRVARRRIRSRERPRISSRRRHWAVAR